MGRAEAGSTKAIANAIKAKGLGRLRWYCQVCEKQCRDENGFQAHTKSEPHLRKILLIGPKANQAIGEYSSRFQKEFMALLKTRHQTTRVRANKVYNEYIQDKHHVHMNGTHWVSLSGFIASIGKAGLVKVDDDGKDLWIQWVDNRPETLEKQAATKKKERAQMDGEERERAMLEAQIARAKEQAGQQTLPEVGLQKKEGEKITLNLFNAPPPTTDPSESTTPEEKAEVKADGETAAQNGDVAQKEESKPTITFGTIGTSFKPPVTAAVNPLKRPAGGNIFKAAKSAKTDSETNSSSSKKSGYMSEAERLMKEDQARRMRNGGGGGYAGAGPRREGNGPAPKRFVLQ